MTADRPLAEVITREQFNAEIAQMQAWLADRPRTRGEWCAAVLDWMQGFR